MSVAFDLEKAFAAWRRPFEHTRVFSAEDLEELENSLRDRVDALIEGGMPGEAAFQEAVRRLGSYATAETEYRKVYWGSMRRRRRLKPELFWRLSLFANYLKIALRNLRKQKGYSFINIAGLSVGLACFLLIGLFVRYELSYDTFHEKADRIYRVVKEDPGNYYLGTNRSSGSLWGVALILSSFVDRDHVVSIDVEDREARTHYEALKQVLSSHSNVLGVTAS